MADSETRRLCAVLLADVTGFSRMMGEDEGHALATLGAVRAVFERTVPAHHGTLDVAVGDCFVALFASAADAVAAAIAIQRALAAAGPSGGRIRIGVHLGDVVRRGTEVFGDSVNIAARLQALAQPGGITISGDVYRAVRGKIDVPFADLGAKRLKNIAHPIHLYAVQVDGAVVGGVSRSRLAVAGLALVAVVASVVSARWVLWSPPSAAGRGRAVAPVTAAPTAERPQVVGVTGLRSAGEVPEWMRDVTRDGLNAVLSKVPALRVFSRQKIYFLRERRGLSELEAAEELGIEKMIAGTVTLEGGTLALDVQVVDTGSGILDAAERVAGRPAELIELQNQLADRLLQALRIALSADEKRQLFSKRTNDTLESYRMLADTFGAGAGAGTGTGTPITIPDIGETSWLTWPRAARADDGSAEAAIRGVLELYRLALQTKNVDQLAAVHVEFSDAQRATNATYFQNADGLTVGLADVDVLVEGDEALATFTRRDVFTDRRSSKPVELEVRLSSVLARSGGAWKMRGVKKS